MTNPPRIPLRAIPPAPELHRAPPDTRLGTVLRVCFFIGAVLAAMWVFGLLFSFFGGVVAATFGLFMTGLCANLLTMRIFDRRPLLDIGLRGEQAIRHFSLGLLTGAGGAACMLTAPLLAGTGHLVARPDATFSWPSLVFYLAVLLFGAAGEEMIFRGYGFQLLIAKIGPFATVLPVGVLFGFAHSLNPHATPLAILNTTLWGTLLGFAFIRSHDLWAPIGLHYGWNVVLPLFGVNLSGLTIEVTRYFYRWDLGPVWTGGDYGPEGGLLTTIFVTVLFFLLVRLPFRPQRAAIAVTLND